MNCIKLYYLYITVTLAEALPLFEPLIDKMFPGSISYVSPYVPTVIPFIPKAIAPAGRYEDIFMVRFPEPLEK